MNCKEEMHSQDSSINSGYQHWEKFNPLRFPTYHKQKHLRIADFKVPITLSQYISFLKVGI